ncbi:TetR/AcrR family transcriptional regulator [Streptomyces sp. NPDC026092]|uniref:TetR/AcrR family transcriptional regulator n=1 Tax=Streptomyces sp. NPDC026092 TaxID=3154797 RepID=UPI0033D4F4ED
MSEAMKRATTSSSLDLLWGTGERPSRGPKPGLTLDRIVTAAVGVADAEGLDAVSMRRVATELGVGTMSLYRYVPGKTELLDLMLDRVQGESYEDDPQVPTHWRDTVEQLARSYRELYQAHPWLLKVNQARSVLGPSALRGLELCLSGLKGPHGMGLSDPETIGVIVTVQSYVAGIARMESQAAEAAQETGVSDEEFWTGQQPFLERAMASGDYPLMAALAEDTFARDFDHFTFGLDRLLDGFEALVGGRSAGAGGRRGGAGG